MELEPRLYTQTLTILAGSLTMTDPVHQ